MNEDEEFNERRSSPGAWCHAASQFHIVAKLIGPSSDGVPNSLPAYSTAFYCNVENALELYLKAFLLANGTSVSRLRKIGHKLLNLCNLAKREGLALSGHVIRLAEMLESGKHYAISREKIGNDYADDVKVFYLPLRYPFVGKDLSISYSGTIKALEGLYQSILPSIQKFHDTPRHDFWG